MADVKLTRYYNSADDTGYEVIEKSTGRYIGWVAKADQRGRNRQGWTYALGIEPGNGWSPLPTRAAAVAALIKSDARVDQRKVMTQTVVR